MQAAKRIQRKPKGTPKYATSKKAATSTKTTTTTTRSKGTKNRKEKKKQKEKNKNPKRRAKHIEMPNERAKISYLLQVKAAAMPQKPFKTLTLINNNNNNNNEKDNPTTQRNTKAVKHFGQSNITVKVAADS